MPKVDLDLLEEFVDWAEAATKTAKAALVVVHAAAHAASVMIHTEEKNLYIQKCRKQTNYIKTQGAEITNLKKILDAVEKNVVNTLERPMTARCAATCIIISFLSKKILAAETEVAGAAKEAEDITGKLTHTHTHTHTHTLSSCCKSIKI